MEKLENLNENITENHVIEMHEKLNQRDSIIDIMESDLEIQDIKEEHTSICQYCRDEKAISIDKNICRYCKVRVNNYIKSNLIFMTGSLSCFLITNFALLFSSTTSISFGLCSGIIFQNFFKLLKNP